MRHPLGGRPARRAAAGSAVIEFALTFMLLWLLLGGAFRFGYSMYVYESLVSAVAGAARYAARVDFDSPGHAFIDKVKNMAAYGSPVSGTAPLAPGLTTANVRVVWATDASGYPTTMTVSIVNYSVNAVFQTFAWDGKPSVTVRFAGRYLS
jgi:Flp pilus assembly protein TadG